MYCAVKIYSLTRARELFNARTSVHVENRIYSESYLKNTWAFNCSMYSETYLVKKMQKENCVFFFKNSILNSMSVS